MSDTSRALDSIASALAQRLKARGYRKTGRMWRRHADGAAAIQVVNLQGSVWNHGSVGRCALNAAIYFPALAELIGRGRVTDRPTEPDCHLRVRPAMLRPDGRDTWFEFQVDDVATVATAGESIARLYDEFGEPWLARLSSLAGARDELSRTGQHWWASAASLELGDRAMAVTFLLKAIANAPKAQAPHLIRWGERHSLLGRRDAAI